MLSFTLISYFFHDTAISYNYCSPRDYSFSSKIRTTINN